MKSYQTIVYENRKAAEESARIEAAYIRRNMIHKTRVPEMGYQNPYPGAWMFVDLQDGRHSHVGPHYPTKAALLADAERYLTEYGYQSLK